MNTAARAARIVARRQPQNRFGSLQACRTLSTTSSAVAVNDSNSNSNSNDNSNSNLPAKLIDFSISAKIEGEESQVAMVKLRPGETLRAESGAMLFMTQNVEMNTDLQGASAAMSRMMTGQNVFLTDFTYNSTSGEGLVGLGTDFPSKIVRLTLEDYENSTLICQRGAFMASNPSVNIDMEFTKSLSAGFFGGQGFILQRLSGQGDVLVKAGGTLVEKDLSEGETLRVSSGSIVAFTSTVDYDIQMIPGIKNAMFGGEGLFVTTLKGPGKVWLQGMPADRMISEIARRVPSGGIGLGIPLGVGGGGGGGEGAAAGDEAAQAGVEGAAPGSGEEMVAATDGAVDADRQATVASSGMMDSDDGALDSESPSALFGDAASQDAPLPSSPMEEPSSTFQQDDFFSKETTFSDEGSTFTDETAFSDDSSFSTDDFSSQSQDGFDDPTQTDFFDTGSGVTEEASEAGGGMFRTLWDFFTGDD
jgi:uncharacterized protein (TIGR00266 family)